MFKKAVRENIKIPIGAIKTNCDQCKTVLWRTPYRLSIVKWGSFCNRSCMAKFKSEKLSGEMAAKHKIGYRTYNKKYIEVSAKWHPCAKSKKRNKYIPLHRLLLEAKLKRFLCKDEVVHHIDGDFTNNHWDNLEAITNSDHAKKHNKDRKRTKGGRYV